MAKLDLNVLAKTSSEDKYQIVEFRGDMDKSNNSEVRDALSSFIETFADRFLILDLTYFNFINSEGVGLMVSLYYKMKKVDKELFIINPQPAVNDVFNIIGLPKIVKVFNSLNEALADIK